MNHKYLAWYELAYQDFHPWLSWVIQGTPHNNIYKLFHDFGYSVRTPFFENSHHIPPKNNTSHMTIL